MYVYTCVHKFESHAGKNAPNAPAEFTILVGAMMHTDLLTWIPTEFMFLSLRALRACTRNLFSFHYPGCGRPVIGPRTLTIHILPQALASSQGLCTHTEARSQRGFPPLSLAGYTPACPHPSPRPQHWWQMYTTVPVDMWFWGPRLGSSSLHSSHHILHKTCPTQKFTTSPPRSWTQDACH